MEQCNTCGLPEDLCLCDEVDDKGDGRVEVSVHVEERTHNRKVTVVEFEEMNSEVSLDELASSLKKEFACGGTSGENHIELQGDYRDRVKEAVEEKI